MFSMWIKAKGGQSKALLWARKLLLSYRKWPTRRRKYNKKEKTDFTGKKKKRKTGYKGCHVDNSISLAGGQVAPRTEQAPVGAGSH